MAATTGSGDGSVWWTVSTRWIRLNSSAATPAILPSLLRISVSSVGQSIASMR